MLGNKELGSSIKQVFFTTFGVAKQYDSITYAIYQKTSRANENLKLLAVYMNETKSLEVSNELRVTMNDYEQIFENGTANITKLAVSENIEFGYENSQVDDTAGIQHLLMEYDSKQSKYIFIKVSTKTPLNSTKSMKIYINDDAHINSKQLFFR